MTQQLNQNIVNVKKLQKHRSLVEFLTLEQKFLWNIYMWILWSELETKWRSQPNESSLRMIDSSVGSKGEQFHTLVDLQIHPVENTWDLTGLAAWGCCGFMPGLQNSKAELSGASRDGRVLGAFCVRGKCNSPFHRKCVKTWQPMTSKLVQQTRFAKLNDVEIEEFWGISTKS